MHAVCIYVELYNRIGQYIDIPQRTQHGVRSGIDKET